MANQESLFDLDNSNNESPYIDGQAKAIFFSSPDSFYKVILVAVSDTNLDWNEDEIVVTGNFGEILEDSSYHFDGKLVQHPRYGYQFQATNYKSQMVTTEEGVIKYLSGDHFPGIGKQTAKKIVDGLGEDALMIINDDASVLSQLGLSKKQQKVIIDNLNMNDSVEEIIIGLNSYGFSNLLASNIYQKYQADTITIIQQNPYKLVEDIDGISFKKADSIARNLGFKFDDPKRIQAGILYAIDTLCSQNGDIYTTTGPLTTLVTKLLDVVGEIPLSGEKLAEQLTLLVKEGKVAIEDDHIYPDNLFKDEWQIAEHINRLIVNQEQKQHDREAILKKMRVIEKQNGIVYDDSQTEAIISAINSPIFALTGGPGTGKTTIINGIVNTYAKLNDYSLDINAYKDTPFPIVLAAPTGRAAKNMADSTGLPASTIHRLLGLNGHGSENDETSSNRDLNGKLMIIDEMSMVDTSLFKALIQAVPNQMQVILVGDQDQLPSVGPGQVFHDLLASSKIPVQQLSTIHRQEAQSTIVQLAHAIHDDHLPADFTVNQPDRSFIPCHESQIPGVINQIVSRAKQKNFNEMDVQVLSPMYKGGAGIDELNQVSQNIWLKDKTVNKEVTIRNHTYHIGDKVLQLINTPDKNVFNGDIGVIVGMEIPKKQSKVTQITIDFDETEVTYSKNEWNQFTLAYCTSIHKAQGSEFKMVILPLVMKHSRMLQKNLLYTAITRAKDFLIMIGELEAYQTCVNTAAINRKTTLIQRLKSVIHAKDYANIFVKPQAKEESKNVIEQQPIKPDVLSEKLILSNQIDPMIGMDNLSPNDFA